MHCLLTFTCVITSGIQSGLSVRASSCQPSFIHMDFLGTRLAESEFMVVGVVFSVSRVEPAGSLERGLPWRRSEEETGFCCHRALGVRNYAYLRHVPGFTLCSIAMHDSINLSGKLLGDDLYEVVAMNF